MWRCPARLSPPCRRFTRTSQSISSFSGSSEMPYRFTHVYIPKPVRTFGRHALFPSDRTHPDGESCNEQAYRNKRQNVVDEIGHVGNSSVFTYVYFLFYFCSKVNTCSATAFILGFTNNEYTTTGMHHGSEPQKGVSHYRIVDRRMFRPSRASPFETPLRRLLRMRCRSIFSKSAKRICVG